MAKIPPAEYQVYMSTYVLHSDLFDSMCAVNVQT
jgi:hypothetical protein